MRSWCNLFEIQNAGKGITCPSVDEVLGNPERPIEKDK